MNFYQFPTGKIQQPHQKDLIHSRNKLQQKDFTNLRTFQMVYLFSCQSNLRYESIRNLELFSSKLESDSDKP